MASNVTEYPFIFFPVGLNVRGRSCVVIGNDREALEKAESLREIGANVMRIEDASQMRDADVVDAFLVISTPQDVHLSERLRTLADAHRFLLCCIDQPRYGFVAMQAVVKAGPVRVAISTGGIAPRIGKLLKEALERSFDTRFVRFIDCMHALRERNRERLSTAQERRAAMLSLADGFRADLILHYPAWFMENDAESVLRTLTDLGRTVVTAESITGGGIADALVCVPGASRCFLGGVTAYDNALKTRVLGVDEEVLRAQGAVSEQVAVAMARGARERLGADFAIASTGIAGPTGAMPGKPVGLVWFALAQPTGAVDTHSRTFVGERNDIRRQAIACGTHFLRVGVEKCLGIPRHTGEC